MSLKKIPLPVVIGAAAGALALSFVSLRRSEGARARVAFPVRPSAESSLAASPQPLEPELLEASAGPLSLLALPPRSGVSPAPEASNAAPIRGSAAPLRDALAPASIAGGSLLSLSFASPKNGSSAAAATAPSASKPAVEAGPSRAALAASRAGTAAGAASRRQAIARLRPPSGAAGGSLGARPFAASPASAKAEGALAEMVWSAMETETPAPNVAITFSSEGKPNVSATTAGASSGSGPGGSGPATLGNAAAARSGEGSGPAAKAKAKPRLPGAHMSHQQKYALFWAFARAKLGPKVFRHYRLRGMTILLALRRSTNANHAYPDRFVFLTRHDFVTLQGSTQPSSSRAGISMIKPGRYLGVHNGLHTNAIGLTGPSWWIKTLNGSGALPDWRDSDGDGRYRGRGEAYNSTAYEILLHIGRSSIGCLNYRPADTQRVVNLIGGPSRDFVMVLSQVK